MLGKYAWGALLVLDVLVRCATGLVQPCLNISSTATAGGLSDYALVKLDGAGLSLEDVAILELSSNDLRDLEINVNDRIAILRAVKNCTAATLSKLEPAPVIPSPGSQPYCASRASRCNLREHQWILVLGTGRSGSTTMLEMVNFLPSVEMSGEHDGDLLSFYDFRKHVRTTKRHVDEARHTEGSGTAWLHEREQLQDEEVYCMMQR